MRLDTSTILTAGFGLVSTLAVDSFNSAPLAEKSLAKRDVLSGSWWPTSNRNHVTQLPQSMTCTYKGNPYEFSFDALAGITKGAGRDKKAPAECDPCWAHNVPLASFPFTTIQVRLVFRVKDEVKGIGQQIDFYKLYLAFPYKDPSGEYIEKLEECTQRSENDIKTWTWKNGVEADRKMVARQTLR